MTNAQRRAGIERSLDNHIRLLILLDEVIADPKQSTIDSLINAASTDSKLATMLDHSLDGESYNFTGYREALLRSIEQLRKLQTMFQGPYEIRSRAVSW